MNQMIRSFETLYPTLNCPGVYLVEDTHACFFGGHFADREDKRTFLHHAHALSARLHEWTGRAENFGRLGRPPATRAGDAPVSEFCRTTNSVCFYDSVVVFERRHRPEPWHEVR